MRVEASESECIRVVLFFFNDTATTEICTLSLHDALPISLNPGAANSARSSPSSSGTIITLSDSTLTSVSCTSGGQRVISDRKSTRLNSSHANISYAVFCLKKKKISTYANFISQYSLHSLH